MRRHPLDFVQVSYNVQDREVEARILPLAALLAVVLAARRRRAGTPDTGEELR